MNKRILLAVDADLSPATRHALHVVGEFMAQTAPQTHIVLLHVIPLMQTVVTHPGMYAGHILSVTETASLQDKAENVLRKARLLLEQEGIEGERVEMIIRTGAPADEVAKAARELSASFIVVGSRGSSFKQRVRRFFVGSISRRILQLAPCPVMIVTPPLVPHVEDLVSWYKEAITRYMNEHPASLLVFTPQQAAQQFSPSPKPTPGRKELQAAARALEQLADSGRLFRHSVKGELRYVND